MKNNDLHLRKGKGRVTPEIEQTPKVGETQQLDNL